MVEFISAWGNLQVQMGETAPGKKTSERLHKLLVALFLAEPDDRSNVVPWLGKMGIGIRFIRSVIVF